jgi:hypothetical protein
MKETLRMKFLLMLTDIPGEWDRIPAGDQAGVLAAHGALEDELRSQSRFVTSGRLRPADEARTVRVVAGGGRSVTDGPFAETKEVMGGYYVIDCGSIDEAVGWAKRIPLVYGSIEVRPLWE